MISKGDFGAEVVAAALTVAQGTGTEQVAVQFRFMEGADEGSTITEYLALSDAALPYTVEKLRTCGWTGDDISVLDMLVGTRVRLKVVHEDYQGKTRARVRFINPWRELKRLAAEETQGIAARLRSKIAAIDAAAGNGAAPVPPAATKNPAEDDIPF